MQVSDQEASSLLNSRGLFSKQPSHSKTPAAIVNSQWYDSVLTSANVGAYLKLHQQPLVFRPSSKTGYTTISILTEDKNNVINIQLSNLVLNAIYAKFVQLFDNNGQQDKCFLNQLVNVIANCLKSADINKIYSLLDNHVEKYLGLKMSGVDSPSDEKEQKACK